MYNGRNKKLRKVEEAGITLVALVVTIIVLLILAGITISLVLGQNGVLNRAQYASNSWANATADEEAAMGQFASDVDSLTAGFIEREGGSNSNTVIKIGTTDLSSITGFNNSEGLKNYYGETTDFKSATSGTLSTIDWQLFYDDTDNIYLMASDYIPKTLYPSGIIASDDNDYAGAFVYDTDEDQGEGYWYSGAVMTDTRWKDGGESAVFNNNSIADNYLKWINFAKEQDDYDLNNPNMRAVAFMMDTSMWSQFAGGISGAKAIGGPTIELFALSYNAGSGGEIRNYNTLVKYDSELGNYEDLNVNEYGYYWGEADLYAPNSAEDNMWWIISDDKATGYWLASPAFGPNGDYGYYNDDLCVVTGCTDYGQGSSELMNWINCIGFRPVVYIPKSSL